jgi:DNA-binding GntR family transcriptional regulator
VERIALTTQVYERLLERVVDRRYPPGHRLNADQLARELRVSITPVREALVRLSSQHLVQFEPFKGYSALPAMDTARLRRLFDVRIMVETSAVGAAFARPDGPRSGPLRDNLATMSAHSPPDRPDAIRTFNDTDQGFHQTLVELAGNEFLSDVYHTLSPHIHIGRFYHDRTALATQAIIAEHGAIVQAYERRDAAGAEDCLRRHLEAAWQRLQTALMPPSMEDGASALAGR